MSVLVKPVITEKTTNDSELNNRFTFVVNKKANKVEIKKAVEAKYGVTVDAVRTMNVRPERSRKYTKTGIQTAKTNAYKKAIIQVAEGDTIDLYTNE